MKSIVLLILIYQGLFSCAHSLEQDKSMHDSSRCIEMFEGLEQIMSDLQENGKVRVMVALNVYCVPEKELSPDEVIIQRKNIAQTQDELIDELGISSKFVLSKMKTLPFITLLLDRKKLFRLACHPLVKSVGYDKTVHTKE